MVKNRVLILYDGYLPAKNFGGPVVSLSNLINLCEEEIEFYIFTLNHDLNEKRVLNGIQQGANKIGKATVYYFSNNNFNIRKFKNIIEEIQPNVIYQNGFFNYKILKESLKLSSNSNLPLIIAPRGELNKNALAIKKWKKGPYAFLFKYILIRNKNTYFHSTSPEESKAIEKKLNIENKKIYQLENIPTLNDANLLLNNEKNKGKVKIIFLSRIQVKKNLLYAIKIVNEIESIQIEFDIYGPIENPEYWDECKKSMKSAKKNISFNYCGVVERDKIFEVFSNYDIFFFPTLSENYGHVIVEALSAACPILISDQTPWTDINNFGGGYAISLNNKELFKEKIMDIANLNNEEYYMLRIRAKNYIKSKYSLEDLKKKYSRLFNEIKK